MKRLLGVARRRSLSIILSVGLLSPVMLAPAPASANPCHWRVVWNTAGVYDLPTISQPALKLKHLGDIVGPYCTKWWNSSEGYWFTMVHCDCAPDSYGWMRSAALNPA